MPEGIDIICQGVTGVGETSDEELVRRVREGEKQAYAVLVRRHQRRVYWIIHGILQNEADSEEILQESFLKAFEHIGDFRGESRFRTWLIQIAINEARMRQRKYRARLYDSLDEEPPEAAEFRPLELADWRPNPEQQLARVELGRLLQRGIRSLPKAYREVLLLRDVEGLSNQEAATALGISLPAAKTRLLRARLLLREFLAPHFRRRWQDRLRGVIRRPGRSE